VESGNRAALGLKTLRKCINEAVEGFPRNAVCERLLKGTFTLHHYTSLLGTLFHQTYYGPYTLARAAANCPWRYSRAKEYLIQHAEEERGHWRWILNDLESIGYEGPSPISMLPHYTTQAYIGLNYYVAEEAPIARLAIAAVLEGIGAKFGNAYAKTLVDSLNLQPRQVSFFRNHAITDEGHVKDLDVIIESCEPSQEDWGWMLHAAAMAGRYYHAIYDHEAFK